VAASQFGKSGCFGSNTIPKGLDKDSQDYVHWIDFSNFKTEGKGYYFKLPTVNSDTNYSHPFDISADIYSKMKFDALAFFYHKRSVFLLKCRMQERTVDQTCRTYWCCSEQRRHKCSYMASG